ncbi:MAG: diguanylate cyclase [Alphaproteobacteria bacterium]|nr:diguanylate cyclase [Alphaproteobacteria bacterium]
MIAEHSPSDLVLWGTNILLGFIVIPVWMAMGLVDYFCHRATDIAHTAGTRESVMHLAQLALVGVPLTMALFLEIDAGLLLLMIVFIVLHHAVAFADLSYASTKRAIPPVEQMVHSFLEIMPIAAFLLAGAIAFAQLEALFGFGDARADFALRLRQPPLPVWYIAAVLAAAFTLNLVPYLEELLRCLRADRRTRH